MELSLDAIKCDARRLLAHMDYDRLVICFAGQL